MERGSAEHENWLKSIDPTYVARTPDAAAAAAPDAAAEFVTTARLKSALGGIGAIVMKMITRQQAPLEARIAALEQRLKETAGGTPTWALADLAKQLAHLERCLDQPVRPIYDEGGKLVGAQRETSYLKND